MIGKLTNKLLSSFGYELSKKNVLINDILQDKEFMKLYELCKPYTMTSIERMYSLHKATEYIINNTIEGDFVECGVWKGGSSMMIAGYLNSKKITNRTIYLYDTFEGMVEPTADDVSISGESADKTFKELAINQNASEWCNSSLDEVKSNMAKTGFNAKNIIYCKGKVEDTIPQQITEKQIALLRLDTDWYTSTKHELIHLYPKLITKGILIIDDFGHWDGAKKAVLEYFTEHNIQMLLNRIDYTGRIGIKN